MGREFELKYAASEESLTLLQARYPGLVPRSMETTYYDVPSGALGAMRWTLRRRWENGKGVCTLKTPRPDGSRNEWEVPCGEISDAIPLLCAMGAPDELAALTAGGVIETCGARFTRLAGNIDLENATVELALDRGVLTGGGWELPFAEVEVELKSGSQTAATAFAAALAQEFRLRPESRSKAARACALAKK